MKSSAAVQLAALGVVCALWPEAALRAHDLAVPGPIFIGVFADSQGTRCNIPAPIGTIGTFYVLAIGTSGPADFSGAEFRIDGFPSAWVPTVIPSPLAAISVGNPLQGGCNIAFSTCQQADVLLLYTVKFEVWSQLQNIPLYIRRHSSCWEWWCCPLWTLCDAFYTKMCLPDGEVAVLNGSADPCVTAVEPRSWSRTKGLFR